MNDILYNAFLDTYVSSFSQALTVRDNHIAEFHRDYAYEEITTWQAIYNGQTKPIFLDSFTEENFDLEGIFTVSETGNVFTGWTPYTGE